MSKVVLEALDLGKRYRQYATPRHRLSALLGLADHATSHWALKDVSFKLNSGQCLGVIGDNGAGKSTLLKLLAGTLQPSHGQVRCDGRATAILELGAGFHPDFTGRENLFYGGSFLGYTRPELLSLCHEIIAFSELAEAIDRPVKSYSSGMVVRLAFALVTAVQPEVLIIDEALAVGDQHFQKKCIQRITRFRERGCTILFCSHSLYHVRQLCDTVLWLDQGRVCGYGDTDAILSNYELHVRQQEAQTGQGQASANPEVQQAPNPLSLASGQGGYLTRVHVAGLTTSQTSDAVAQLFSEDLVIRIEAVTVNGEHPSMGAMIEQYQGVGITSVATHTEGEVPTRIASQASHSTWGITLSFPQLPLHSGQYVLSIYLFDSQGLVILDEWKNHVHFVWSSPSLTPGLVKLPHHWTP